MPEATIPKVLTIAGSDPTGGAGLQLDLQVLAAHGVHGMAVPTALTVQSTERVQRVLPAFPSVVAEQIAFLLADMLPDAIKIGMLATDDIVLRVGDVLGRHAIPRVVDPVLRASDGTFLLERRAWGNLLERICAGAALVTPNLPEARELTGHSDPERAAKDLLEVGARAVLIKGGHADGPPDDFLLSAEGSEWIRAEHAVAGGAHGTGCALSAAIAARLALGDALGDAVRAAKRYVEAALAEAFRAGRGQKILRASGAVQTRRATQGSRA
jgi:hydroxymethylpyrimidine kinase/phosphomethylpyrimidine kinase